MAEAVTKQIYETGVFTYDFIPLQDSDNIMANVQRFCEDNGKLVVRSPTFHDEYSEGMCVRKREQKFMSYHIDGTSMGIFYTRLLMPHPEIRLKQKGKIDIKFVSNEPVDELVEKIIGLGYGSLGKGE